MENDFVLKDKIDALKGIVREFGSFAARLDESFNVVFEDTTGWKIAYPYGSDTWVFLVSWIEKWGDAEKACVENFIKGVVYPTSTRLYGTDKEYVTDIIGAHERLTKRMTENGLFENGEKEEQESEEKDE